MLSMNKMKLISAIYEAVAHYGINEEEKTIASLIDRLLLEYSEEITGKEAK